LLICRAPLLEEVDLTVMDNLSKQDIDTLNILLPQRMVFQNLINFNFSLLGPYNLPGGVELAQALVKMAKNIVCFCPKLQTLSITGLDCLYNSSSNLNLTLPILPFSNSHVPFLDLLNIF